MDPVNRIIACARRGEVDNQQQWLARHEEQADGDVLMDEVGIDGGDAFCVAYEPAEEIEVQVPNRLGDDGTGEELVNRVYQESLAGVHTPIYVDCEAVFARRTDLPKFDGELRHTDLGNPYYMAYINACIEPEAFLNMQYNMYRLDRPTDRIVDYRTWLGDHNAERVAEIREDIEAGEQSWPRPFIVLDRDGEVQAWQEGRHRGIAAVEAGIPLMDVYIFWNTDSTRGSPEREYAGHVEYPASL